MVAEGGERVSLPRAGRLEQEDALLLDAEYGDEEAATAALVEQLASQSHTVPTQDASAAALVLCTVHQRCSSQPYA